MKNIFFETYTYDETIGVWYRPNIADFDYTDGAESALYTILAEAEDLSVFSNELRGSQVDWPTTYHLSFKRANLLRPLEKILRNARVLELGCGCGAITRYLAETSAETVAVEGSLKRAAITALRCRDLRNVSVIADTIQNLPESPAGFDVVTLIGVLEYARVFGGPDAETLLLRRARSFLRPNGILILALENRFGLKYFAGVPEDHLGIPWSGVMGAYTKNGVHTWSRKEMEKLLRNAGFGELCQFVPVPDYKLPTGVITPAGLIEEEFRPGPLLSMRRREWEKRPIFNVGQSWEGIAEAGLLADLADSLCFAAINGAGRPEVWPENALAFHYASPTKCCSKEVRIERGRDGLLVRRRLLFPELVDAESPIRQTLSDEPYLFGELLIESVRCLMTRRGWTAQQLAEVLRPWIDWLNSKLEPETGKLPFRYIDAGLINIITGKDGSINYFDCEWDSVGTVSVQNVIVRSLCVAFKHIDRIAVPGENLPLGFWDLTQVVMSKLGYCVDSESLKKFLVEALKLDETLFGPIGVERVLKDIDNYSLQLIYEGSESVNTYLAELNHVYSSRSWRITKPLRSIGAFCRSHPGLLTAVRFVKNAACSLRSSKCETGH
jgi:SAM-dependent methyltransferase